MTTRRERKERRRWRDDQESKIDFGSMWAYDEVGCSAGQVAVCS